MTKVLIVAAGEIVACGLRDVLVEGGCADTSVAAAGADWRTAIELGLPDVVVSDERSAGPVDTWVSAGFRVIVVSPDHARMTVYAGTDGAHEGPLTEELLVAAATTTETGARPCRPT